MSSFPIDISPVLSNQIAVFPGDQPFHRRVSMDIKKGDHLGLSSIETSLHVGAHTDAPNHYVKDGRGIEQQDLRIYFGPCQVVKAIDFSEEGRILDSENNLKDLKDGVSRVLFRTESFPNPDRWNSDFASLSPELIGTLAGLGVKLVGIDTPSIDPESSKALESHSMVAEKDLAILEGVVLKHVDPGVYCLMALPLPIKNGDASPVRAILLPEGALKEPLTSYF